MKLELKENMYVRTKDGIIDKILKLNKSYVKGVSQKDELYAYDIDNIVKASYDIIDLIEEGDYVNGKIVISIYEQDNKYYQYGKEFITHDKMIMYGDMASVCKLENLQIKSIVTKEMYSSVEYRVETD